MKMDKVASSKNDEFYTPEYAILPILPYLSAKKYRRVWCPFDTEESNFVKLLTNKGLKVVFSHKQYGEDFFDTDYTSLCDCIVSNPPYSKKGEVIDRLFRLGKPFAMLVGVVGLFESQKRFEMFKNNPFEILYFNRRISFFKNYSDQNPSLNPPFSSVYICSGVLDKQICFSEINKKGKI